MAKFVTTSEFAELNVGFALDEGIATPHEVFDVYYCERTSWCKLYISLHCLQYDSNLIKICL